METTAEKKTPFYQIIIDDILAQIAAGSFSYDQPICTENSLIEQYGFSRITVRRAMTELENRGILYRKRGVGSFVCHPEELAPALPETSSSPAGKLFAFVFPFHVSKTGLTDAFHNYHMGITAENICEQWGLTREELDEFAAWSQNKCEKAMAEGKFKDEIVPVEVKKKKETILVDTDEGPRKGITKEGLAKLRPAFKKDGMVTAGNASGINDGAAALIVMSEEKAKELGVTPMATWIGGELAGCDPAIMGIGPVYSTRKVMKKLGMEIGDFDLIEANEAFAAQSVAVGKDLGFDLSKLNVNGGAIALGHPVGCSGARILVSLLYEMQKEDVHTGLATLCVGGGMGCSAVVKRD